MIFDNLLPIAGSSESRRGVVIAGPCSAESHNQVLETAIELSQMGVKVFRAGVWKPRTKPGSFEGMGAEALPWIAEVRRTTGMHTATEVATPEHVSQALAAGIDVLWIGARTTVNPFAVQSIADKLAVLGADRRDELTVLVKNPVNPDLELWIGAMERIYNSGIRRLGAIHRGFSIYGQSAYRNAPQWSIPTELRLRLPQLPILCDPSHIGGDRGLVEPIARRAAGMGFDGLIVECHCSPDTALSDASQQITPRRLAEILRDLTFGCDGVQSDYLDVLRERIDQLDDEILDALSRRMKVSREIGAYKRRMQMAAIQPGRYRHIIDSRCRAGEAMGMSREFMQALLMAIHDESVRQQL